MSGLEKEQLISNLTLTALHVTKIKDLITSYRKIHSVPFNSLTGILAVVILLFLFWAVGFTHVIHTVAERIGGSIVQVENTEVVDKENDAVIQADATDDAEEKPLIDLSFITSFFSSQSNYSTSHVILYSVFVAIFDVIFIVGLAIGITYGLFYLYHYIMVVRNKTKLKHIVASVTEELASLEQSFIPQEYWHPPYLARMIRYVELDRVDDLRGCLELMDLEIRHKQIVDALANNQPVSPKLLSESIILPSKREKVVEDIS